MSRKHHKLLPIERDRIAVLRAEKIGIREIAGTFFFDTFFYEKSNSLWNRIWASYANRCLLDIFALLPTHNSFYLLTDNYTGSNIG